jgi:phosphatidylglycerol:prolipoprotein diacylglycerol transferase
MGFLLFISRRFQNKLRDGDVFLVYLILYPIGRFFLEFLRLDPSSVAAINANQTVMGVIAVASALALLIRHRIQPAPKDAAIPSENNPES